MESGCHHRLVLGLDDVLAHARVGGLSKGLDVETNYLGNVVDLCLTALPRGEHSVFSSRLYNEVVVAGADHCLHSSHLEVMHGSIHLGLVGPGLGSVGDDSSMALDTSQVGGEKGVVFLGAVGLVGVGALGGRGSILTDDEAVVGVRSHVVLELNTSGNAHVVGGIVKNASKREENSWAGDAVKVPITLLKIAPEADTEDTGKLGSSLVDMLLEGIAADVERNIDTCLVLSKEGLDIRLELEGVSSTKVNNSADMGRNVGYNAASGSLDDLHFIKGLIRGISDVAPLIHPGGVGNLLGEVLFTLEGQRKLGIENVV